MRRHQPDEQLLRKPPNVGLVRRKVSNEIKPVHIESTEVCLAHQVAQRRQLRGFLWREPVLKEISVNLRPLRGLSFPIRVDRQEVVDRVPQKCNKEGLWH